MTGRALFEHVFSNWIVKILSVAAAVVLFLFYRIGSLEERFIGVPLEHEVDKGFIVTAVSAESVRIDIRGSGDEIFLVLGDDVRAYIDLTSYTSEGIFKAPVMLEKIGSAQTVDVEMIVDPMEVTVTLERKVERELEIVPNMQGYPAVGYELIQYLATPETVTVTGPKSSLSGVERLTTAEISLTGRTSDFSVSVPIEVEDELIVFQGSRTVEIRGFIREVIIEKTFESVPIEYTNVGPPFELTEALQFGSLKLSGPQLTVESLRTLDVGLVVNCVSITSPGNYELPVSAETPPEILALTVRPATVEIEIAKRNQEGTGPPAAVTPAAEETSDGGTASGSGIETDSSPGDTGQ